MFRYICYFNFDNGETNVKKVKNVFVEKEYPDEKTALAELKLILEMNLCKSNEDNITYLRIVKADCYDGIVI